MNSLKVFLIENISSTQIQNHNVLRSSEHQIQIQSDDDWEINDIMTDNKCDTNTNKAIVDCELVRIAFEEANQLESADMI